MIHPSYFELMELVNKDVKEGEEPVITSRYSIVLGTAKRARQLVAANCSTYQGHEEKPLSIAVDELKNGDIHIIRSEEAAETEEPEEELTEEAEEEIEPETAEDAGEETETAEEEPSAEEAGESEE